MTIRVVPFRTMDFVPGGHPLERKKSGGDLSLLEFAVGFEDPNWCTRGHDIYVLSGTFELLTQASVVVVSAGDACHVEPGVAHRARNGGSEPVTLFVVSHGAPG